MTLDIPTLIVMTLVNLFLASVAAIFVWRTNHPMPGLSTIAAGLCVVCASFGWNFFARPFSGIALAACFGNIGMIAGMLMILNGIRRFRGFSKLRLWAMCSLAAPFLLGQTYLFFLNDVKPVKHALFAATIAALCFAGAWTMSYRVDREDRFAYGITAAAMVFYGAVQTLRAVWVLFPGQGLAAETGFLPTLTLLVLNVCLIGCLFGLSTATNHKLRKRIEKLAFCDPLTGLANRRTFDKRLEQVHTRSIATGSPVALVYIDLDRFKAINDRFGHNVGDLALKEVANRLQTVVPRADCLARVGGDEFVVLTERFGARGEIAELVQQLKAGVETPFDLAGTETTLTISCGIALYPDDVSDTSELIREADAGMYVVKRTAALG